MVRYLPSYCELKWYGCLPHILLGTVLKVNYVGTYGVSIPLSQSCGSKTVVFGSRYDFLANSDPVFDTPKCFSKKSKTNCLK
jgi:hypothetical protein